MATLDMYYNRCHLTQDWVSLLLAGPMSTSTMGEDAGNRQTASSAEQGTTGGMAKTSSSEVESLPPESCEALLAVLAAHGVLKSWQSTLRCPACNDTMSKEASYSCEDCRVTYHVRCLATDDFDIPQEQGGSDRQLLYGPRCTLCQVKRDFSSRQGLTTLTDSSNKAISSPLLDDPMGVL